MPCRCCLLAAATASYAKEGFSFPSLNASRRNFFPFRLLAFFFLKDI